MKIAMFLLLDNNSTLFYLFFHRRPSHKLCFLSCSVFESEIEILKAASSKYLLNDVIAGQNDPMSKLLPSSVIWTPRSIVQTKQQKKFRNPTITVISVLSSNCQLPKPGDRINLTPYKTCRKRRANDERPTGKKHKIEWDDSGKIGNKNK